MVSEAGASVYSASELAAKEFPDLDVTLRGAVSIARRLQDPLAELVKIEPKAIGVGQYQHDVDQTGLARSLDAVVEDCVNSVGVDVNTASAPLLARVVGPQRDARRQHRAAPRTRTAPSRRAPTLKKVRAAGAQGVRAGGGLPAHHERQEPARCLCRASRGLPVVEKIAEATKRPVEGDHRRQRRSCDRSSPASSPTRSSASRPSPTFWPSWRSPAATRAPSSRRPTFQEGVEKISDLRARHAARGRGDQRRRRSAPSSTSACTRTAWCTSPSWPTASSRIRARW